MNRDLGKPLQNDLIQALIQPQYLLKSVGSRGKLANASLNYQVPENTPQIEISLFCSKFDNLLSYFLPVNSLRKWHYKQCRDENCKPHPALVSSISKATTNIVKPLWSDWNKLNFMDQTDFSNLRAKWQILVLFFGS